MQWKQVESVVVVVVIVVLMATKRWKKERQRGSHFALAELKTGKNHLAVQR